MSHHQLYHDRTLSSGRPSLWQAFSDKSIVKREITAGITGFFAISYIIIVNPMILADAGIPVNLSVFATILSSVAGCLIMGFWANAPIILTPGMGVNAFFTYTIVVNMGLPWQQALAISILASVLYMLVAFTKLGTVLSAAIPASLKTGITVGIGLFLVEIGLEKASLIQPGKASLIELASLTNPNVLLFLFGLFVNLMLFIKKVNGGFLIGIAVTAIAGILFGIRGSESAHVSLSNFTGYGAIVGKGDFSHLLSLPFLLAVFSMSMILIFESMGMLEGILPDKRNFKRTFEGSAATSLISGILGTSPTVAAAESAAGIESGGRTGIMAVTAGILFALSLFFTPLLGYIPQAAIAPIIFITGAIMMQQLKDLHFDDFSSWFPAFLIIVLIPFTSSISTGLSFGFVAWPVLKILEGKAKTLHPVMILLGAVFLINLICSALL